MMMRRATIGWLAVLAIATTGCGGPDHKAALQDKFQQLVGHLCQDNLEACTSMVDPVYVRAQGTNGVKVQLKVLIGLMKLGKITPNDVRIDEIVVAEDAKTAEVRFSLQSNGAWQASRPSRWVYSEGQWYLTM